MATRMAWPSLAKKPFRTWAVKRLVSPRLPDPCRGGRYLSFSVRCVERFRWFPAVRQQFLDPAVRVCAHTDQDITQIDEWVDAKLLAGRAQAHQRRRRLAPLVTAGEQP